MLERLGRRRQRQRTVADPFNPPRIGSGRPERQTGPLPVACQERTVPRLEAALLLRSSHRPVQEVHFRRLSRQRQQLRLDRTVPRRVPEPQSGFRSGRPWKLRRRLDVQPFLPQFLFSRIVLSLCSGDVFLQVFAWYGSLEKRVACKLPADRGFCRDQKKRYFYDSQTKTCKTFVWGGCQGNANNFATEEQCLSACGPRPFDKTNFAGEKHVKNLKKNTSLSGY